MAGLRRKGVLFDIFKLELAGIEIGRHVAFGEPLMCLNSGNPPQLAGPPPENADLVRYEHPSVPEVLTESEPPLKMNQGLIHTDVPFGHVHFSKLFAEVLDDRPNFEQTVKIEVISCGTPCIIVQELWCHRLLWHHKSQHRRGSVSVTALQESSPSVRIPEEQSDRSGTELNSQSQRSGGGGGDAIPQDAEANFPKLVNMSSSDGHRLYEAASIGCMLAVTPVIVLVGLLYTAFFLGPTALMGSAAFILFYPLMMLASKFTAYFRKKCIGITDQRVRVMNEILTSIRFIKMYAWEKTFVRNIQEELRGLSWKKLGYIQSVTTGIAPIVTVVASVCTFTLHMALGYDLTAPQAFTVVTVFNSMTSSLKIIPIAVRAASEASVSISRFQRLFLMEEIDTKNNEKINPCSVVEFRGAYFTWESEAPVKCKDEKKHTTEDEGATRQLKITSSQLGEEQLKAVYLNSDEKQTSLESPYVVPSFVCTI
ncbi:unnamed protein product [Ranitomeya imitator]|uniref:ABC transmembrane type-1 domain-containing protein n=1 Tax=Ranitomeya imitator TaxID=111125 RepID=A0ABN9KZK9_9NEOB|nr:unnamed protein product [Ranitomeya imitator]